MAADIAAADPKRLNTFRPDHSAMFCFDLILTAGLAFLLRATAYANDPFAYNFADGRAAAAPLPKVERAT
jgi:hypothetical protein